MGRGVLTTLTTTVSDGVCPLSVPSAGSFTHSFSFHPHNLLVGGYEPHSCPQLPRGTAGLQSQVPLQSPCSCPPGDLPQCHPISFCSCLLLSQLLFRSCILCQAALRVCLIMCAALCQVPLVQQRIRCLFLPFMELTVDQRRLRITAS